MRWSVCWAENTENGSADVFCLNAVFTGKIGICFILCKVYVCIVTVNIAKVCVYVNTASLKNENFFCSWKNFMEPVSVNCLLAVGWDG